MRYDMVMGADPFRTLARGAVGHLDLPRKQVQ